MFIVYSMLHKRSVDLSTALDENPLWLHVSKLNFYPLISEKSSFMYDLTVSTSRFSDLLSHHATRTHRVKL